MQVGRHRAVQQAEQYVQVFRNRRVTNTFNFQEELENCACLQV